MDSAVSKQIQRDVFGGNIPDVPSVQEARVDKKDEEERPVNASTGVELAMLFDKNDSTDKSTWKHIRYQYLMLCFLNELGLEDQVNDIPDKVDSVVMYLTRLLERRLLPDEYPQPKYPRWLGDEDFVGYDANKPVVLEAKHQKQHIELDWTTESKGMPRKYEPYDDFKAFDNALDAVWEVLPAKSRLKICAVFSPPWGVLKDKHHDEALALEDIKVCLFTCIP